MTYCFLSCVARRLFYSSDIPTFAMAGNSLDGEMSKMEFCRAIPLARAIESMHVEYLALSLCQKNTTQPRLCQRDHVRSSSSILAYVTTVGFPGAISTYTPST